MNREYKKESLKGEMLPLKIDSVSDSKNIYIEYDGWHFEGTTEEAINQLLKYIFVGGEE